MAKHSNTIVPAQPGYFKVTVGSGPNNERPECLYKDAVIAWNIEAEYDPEKYEWTYSVSPITGIPIQNEVGDTCTMNPEGLCDDGHSYSGITADEWLKRLQGSFDEQAARVEMVAARRRRTAAHA